MGKFTTGIITGAMIGMGAVMMMDPRTRRRTKKMRRNGMRLMGDAGDWVEEMMRMYR